MQEYLELFLTAITNVSPNSMFLFMVYVGIMALFIHEQKLGHLAFADLITGNGTSVSATKLLNLIGGVTATWVIIVLTQGNNLSMDMFIVYLTYIGGIQGFSKFVSAKYNYAEGSVRDSVNQTNQEQQ
jgi:hypothetical protein